MFAIERPATRANGDAGKRVIRDQFAAQATGAADDAEERHADDFAALVVDPARPIPDGMQAIDLAYAPARRPDASATSSAAARGQPCSNRRAISRGRHALANGD
jgi:hypothetical protein